MILTDKNTICNRYIRRKIQKYKQNKKAAVDSDKRIKGVTVRRWIIHPLLIKILQIKSILSGLTYEFISEDTGWKKEGPVIYVGTHICKFDYEMIMEACDIFAYTFAGDWELTYATVDDYFLRTNGVIYVDTEDKEDRKNSLAYMKKVLNQGISVIIFPEGIWNLTESLPIMKIYPGAVQAAKECNVPILPIAIEQKGKHFLINVGTEMDVSTLEETQGVEALRDALASLEWEIWEHQPIEKRADIDNDYYKKFLQEKISEWKPMSYELYDGRRYRDKTERELLVIKKDLEDIHVCK